MKFEVSLPEQAVMNAAAAVAASPGPAAYMGTRFGAAAEVEEPSALAAQTTQGIAGTEKEPTLGRYASHSFVFNPEASRIVLLYRNPSTGETEFQIPSEVALKRYVQAAQEQKASVIDASTNGRDATESGKGGESPGGPGLGSSGQHGDGPTIAAAVDAATTPSLSVPPPSSGGGKATLASMSGSVNVFV